MEKIHSKPSTNFGIDHERRFIQTQIPTLSRIIMDYSSIGSAATYAGRIAYYVLLGLSLLIIIMLQVTSVRSCLLAYKLAHQHDALRKSETLSDSFRPFLRPPSSFLPPLWLALLRAVTLAPFKFIGIILAILTASTAAAFVSPRSALRVASVCGWIVYRLAGVRELKFKGKAASTGDAPLVVANHISWIDFICLGSTTKFGFVMSEAVSKAPIIGPGFKRLALHVDSIVLERQNEKSREAAKSRIREKLLAMQAVGKGERLIVFSEGTLTNGEYVVPLKLGAFEAMVPVQPLRLEVTNPQYSLASLGTVEGTCLFLCLGGTELTATWGEVVKPTADDTPESLAEKVRDSLIKGSKIIKAKTGSYRDHLSLHSRRFSTHR